MNDDPQIYYWAHMLDEAMAGDSRRSSETLKDEILRMIKEARKAGGMRMLAEYANDTGKIDAKIADAAEEISQDQAKLENFIIKNKAKIENALKKLDTPDKKKWYICAWNMVKAAAKAGIKFISKNWALLAKILVVLWIGWMFWTMPDRILGWLMQAWEMYKKAWSEFLNSPTTDKIMQAWAGPESTPATRAIYKMNNTGGFGAFFDPGFSF